MTWKVLVSETCWTLPSDTFPNPWHRLPISFEYEMSICMKFWVLEYLTILYNMSCLFVKNRYVPFVDDFHGYFLADRSGMFDNVG